MVEEEEEETYVTLPHIQISSDVSSCCLPESNRHPMTKLSDSTRAISIFEGGRCLVALMRGVGQ